MCIYIHIYLEAKVQMHIVLVKIVMDKKHSASSFKKDTEELDLPCQQDVVQEIVSY